MLACTSVLPLGPAPPLALRPCAPHSDDGLKLFGEEAGYAAIAREIESVPGVVAHGLYADVAAAAVVATAEGPRELARGVPLSAGAAEE